MIFEEIEVTLELIEPQLGTVGKDKAPFTAHVLNKAVEQDPSLAAKVAEEVLTIEDLEKPGWTGFHCDKKGIHIMDYMIRGFMKAAGNVLKNQLEIKALKSKITNYVFPVERRIYFTRKGEYIAKPDGVLERPLLGETAQGKRVCLAKSDYIEAGAQLSFTLKVLKGPVSIKTIEEIFEYGQLCGLGQWRNGSYGRVKVVTFKKKK